MANRFAQYRRQSPSIREIHLIIDAPPKKGIIEFIQSEDQLRDCLEFHRQRQHPARLINPRTRQEIGRIWFDDEHWNSCYDSAALERLESKGK